MERLSALAAIGLLSVGCNPAAPPAPPISDNIGHGWNCLTTPTAFDGVGTIFRVTPEGTKFTVTNQSDKVDIQAAPWIQPTAVKTVSVGAGVVAELIAIPVSANASLSNKYTIRQSFADAQEVNTTDFGVADLKAAFLSRPGLDRTQRYYLVRRAIVAKSVQYDFDHDLSSSFGVDVAIEVVKVKPNASYSNIGGFHYKDTFPSPQNVCILAESLVLPAAGPSAAASPQPQDADNSPLFSRVGGRDK